MPTLTGVHSQGRPDVDREPRFFEAATAVNARPPTQRTDWSGTRVTCSFFSIRKVISALSPGRSSSNPPDSIATVA